MNGGIQPTVELATNNGAYPVMSGYGNGFGFGGDAIWILLALALFGGFGNGWNNGGNVATTDFVSSQFTQNSLQDLSGQICNGFAGVNSNVSNGFSSLGT